MYRENDTFNIVHVMVRLYLILKLLVKKNIVHVGFGSFVMV